jgi:hypothetical protein
MPLGELTIVTKTPDRCVAPSREAWRAAHRNVTLTVPVAIYELLDGRRAAEGKTFADILLGERADRDRELAEARAQGVAEGTATALLASDGQLAELKREQEEAMAASADQIRAADAAGYQRAGAEANDPAARAKSDWVATQWAIVEKMEVSEGVRLEAVAVARHTRERARLEAERLSHEADAAEAQRRIDMVSDAITAEQASDWEAAKALGAKDEAAKLAPQLAQLRHEREAARAELVEQGRDGARELADTQRELAAAQGQVRVLRSRVDELTGQLDAARHSPLQRMLEQQQEQLALDRERWDAETEQRQRRRNQEPADRKAELEQR